MGLCENCLSVSTCMQACQCVCECVWVCAVLGGRGVGGEWAFCTDLQANTDIACNCTCMDLRVNDWARTCQRVYLSPWHSPSAITLTLGRKAELYCVCMCVCVGWGVGGRCCVWVEACRALHAKTHMYTCTTHLQVCRCEMEHTPTHMQLKVTHLFFSKSNATEWNRNCGKWLQRTENT